MIYIYICNCDFQVADEEVHDLAQHKVLPVHDFGTEMNRFSFTPRSVTYDKTVMVCRNGRKRRVKKNIGNLMKMLLMFHRQLKTPQCLLIFFKFCTQNVVNYFW